MCITPGPWRVDGHADSLMPQAIVKDFPTAGEYGLVCELTHSLFRENQRDNARLIAAAPELLKLLIECQEALDVLSDDAGEAGYPARAESAAQLAMEAREVIRKAEGTV